MLPTNLRTLSMLLLMLLAGPIQAQVVSLSSGQAVYLPVYSHLYHGEVQPKTGMPSMTLVTPISVPSTRTSR